MKRRSFPAWMAIFALLTHLLAMSAVGMPADAAQVHSDTEHARHSHHAELERATTSSHSGHDGAGHAGMLQCCCAGFSGLAALPFDPPRLPDQMVRRVGLLPVLPAAVPLPRDQWPALNPRASPLA